MSNFTRSCLVALQRSGVDPRARRFLLLTTIAVAVLVATFIYYRWAFDHTWVTTEIAGPLFYLFLGVGALISMALFRRSLGMDRELSTFSLDIRTPATPAGSLDALSEYLSDRMLALACMTARGLAEMTASRPDVSDLAIGVRQRVNRCLGTSGIRNKLEADERQLCSSAAGTWTSEQRWRAIAWGEQLRLLRWMLGVDSESTSFALFPRIDVRTAWDFIRPGATRPALRISDQPWLLREQRHLAAQYMKGVTHELGARKGSRIGNDPDKPGPLPLPSEDLLAGARSITELSDSDLSIFAATLRARYQYASYLLDLLEANEPQPFSSWLLRSKEKT